MAYTERYVTSGASGGGDGSSGSPWTLAEAIANAASGDRVNIQSDATYTLGSAITLPNGAAGSPIIWRGYNSTIGDLDAVGRTSATGPLDVSNFPVIDGGSSYLISTGSYNRVECLRLTSSRDGGTLTVNDYSVVARCRIDNTNASGTNSSGVSGSNKRFEITDSDIAISSTQSASTVYGARIAWGFMSRCRVWHTGTPGALSVAIRPDSIGSSVADCIVFNFGVGIQSSGQVSIRRCTIYDVVNGMSFTTGAGVVENNVIYSADYAFAGSSASSLCLESNACGSLASGRINTSGLGADLEERNAISLTGDPFTNAASEDFTLNNTAGAGAACRAASDLWGGYLDIGAVQHQDSGGGGGTGGWVIGGS